MRQLTAIIFFYFTVLNVQGQPDSSWNVLVLKKGNKVEIKKDMAAFSNSGFYLYRNCVYEIALKSNQPMAGRLVDIRPDTLLFTNYFNTSAAMAAHQSFDTIAVHYQDLDRLNLVEDRTFGFYAKHSFCNYDFIFSKDTLAKYFPSSWGRIYQNDTMSYELVAHLTGQGICTLFEENGRTYFFYGGGMIKPDRSKMDVTYSKRSVVWFTPCAVEEINGVAIGLHPKNMKNDMYGERDTLLIRGLNLELNPFAFITLLSPYLTGPYPDSLNIYNDAIKDDWWVKVNGVNISAVSTINEMRIKGVNITGAITTVDEIEGLTISGVNNFSYLMKGVSIAGLRNRATSAKGVQVALVNKATKLHGFQIGLWNINGKRSLPFINWQFKS